MKSELIKIIQALEKQQRRLERAVEIIEEGTADANETIDQIDKIIEQLKLQ
jgi:exonuclease VII small subunit